ncbi:MAG: lycopene cyclase domain-containing protein [Chitinophagaceae bacterium]
MSHSISEFWTPSSRTKLKVVFILMSIILIIGLWISNEVKPDMLQQDVESIRLISLLESRWLYAGLLVFTGIFPLIFGFLPKLQFHKQWTNVLLANIPVTIFFLLWDWYFTKNGVWGFSDSYTSGFTVYGLPWEECMFFLIIPVACIFIYWSLNSVIVKEPFASLEKTISVGLAILFFGIGFWKWDHIYTSTASLLSALFLVYHVLFIGPGYRGRFYLAYLVSCIPFLLVNGVLTGGFTKGPVVMYNPEEYFGIRVGTVPVDDFVYSFLMLFLNITLFERLRTK